MLWSTPMTSRPASPSDRLDNGPHGSRCGGAPSRGTAHAQRSHACHAPWAVAARSRPSRNQPISVVPSSPHHVTRSASPPDTGATQISVGPAALDAHATVAPSGERRGLWIRAGPTPRRHASARSTDPIQTSASVTNVRASPRMSGNRRYGRLATRTTVLGASSPRCGPPADARRSTASEASIRPGRAFRCRGSLKTGAGDSGRRHVRDGDGNYPRPATKQRHHRHHRGGPRDGRDPAGWHGLGRCSFRPADRPMRSGSSALVARRVPILRLGWVANRRVLRSGGRRGARDLVAVRVGCGPAG